jgi:hypothetical protein
MDVGGFIQNFGDALMTMAILGYWLKAELAAKSALELKVDKLQGEVKDDLRSVLPLLQESTRLMEEIGIDGTEQVERHLVEIKELIQDVKGRIN